MLQGYRTIIFNIVMAIATMITLFTGVDTSEDIPKLKDGIDLLLQGLTVVWGIGGIWFRMITTSPIFKRK